MSLTIPDIQPAASTPADHASPARAPRKIPALVRAHEQEHVANEQVRAKEQGSRVVSQSVSIQYSICPECGRSYVAGGTTTTVTKPDGNEAGAAENSPGFPGLDVIA